MARLAIEHLIKSFGATRVLDDVSLDVQDGEFVAILGPSGCGKTTLLRQVAGFDKADAGRILIGDTVVSAGGVHLPPEKRRIGIVFQSYALWPHMSVADNVGYGLTVSGVKGDERARRVAAALALVNLEGMAERMPAMLSGGQRQRVALARCLVTEPSLVLLDEPLANLDVHLRAAMEREFARFHERTGTTMLYITHDQAEAMALADRIAVMHRGRVLQFASPSELYREPADDTIASFVGEGMVLPVEVRAVDGATCSAELFGHALALRCKSDTRPGPASVCLRAEALRVVDGHAPGFGATVQSITYEGGRFRIEADIGNGAATLHFHQPEPCPLACGERVTLTATDGWIIPRRDPVCA